MFHLLSVSTFKELLYISLFYQRTVSMYIRLNLSFFILYQKLLELKLCHPVNVYEHLSCVQLSCVIVFFFVLPALIFRLTVQRSADHMQLAPRSVGPAPRLSVRSITHAMKTVPTAASYTPRQGRGIKSLAFFCCSTEES